MILDIDQFSEAELRDLNRRIVERLKFMQQIRAHTEMLKFSLGDTVCFFCQHGTLHEGVVTRYNKKTVSVVARDGVSWTVSPTLLRRKGDPTTVTVHAHSAEHLAE